ncbi:hypothetical protein ONE63_004928 [Megalurothrips usitatus]|uniref:RNA helicase n=1 Tax=Megalurothrips usitatus TaxID=439358 RepID=A0AAV7X4U3_9NEOP|nr:hypothetical protein ONE63_004928 [Megalurothrips usitatus]
MARPKFDVVKTIEDDEDVSDYSDKSDEEETYQPTKQKQKKKADFETEFHFLSSVQEYNKDTWVDDIDKYIKRKGRDRVEGRIERARYFLQKVLWLVILLVLQEQAANGTQNGDGDDDGAQDVSHDIEISDDELKKDDIRVSDRAKRRAELRKRKGKGGQVLKVEAEEPDSEDDFFDDAPPFDENTTFTQMNLSRPLLKAIGTMNYVHPTPIQAATIPVALQGRDICGCAATGTGKTAAYMLPVLERLLYKPAAATTTRVLVLVPTRELGVQVYQVTRQLSQFTLVETGLSVGGLDVKSQEAVLRKNPDIVIATPGRLIDHIRNTPSFTLDSIEVLILDEADRMLDENFAEQMKEIIRQTSRARQTMLFSATMTTQVEDLASVSLNKPVKIFVDTNQQVAFNLRQEFIKIRSGRESDREAILAALVCRTFRDHTMVFVTTKFMAHRVRIFLGLLGLKVGELHGNLTQPQRLEALQQFKDEELDILVATDVAARGLDIRGVKTVINFMMPAVLEHYIHRVGRTARAGRSGVSVSLVGENERRMVKDIVKNTTNPVKSRVIPPEIIAKYRKKVDAVRDEVKNILDQERDERLLNSTENQVNRLENKLQGVKGEKRDWFQTKKEREAEKNTEKSNGKTANGKGKAKGKGQQGKDQQGKGQQGKGQQGKNKKPVDEDEARMQKDLQKVSLLHARMAKRQSKGHKISTIREGKGL